MYLTSKGRSLQHVAQKGGTLHFGLVGFSPILPLCLSVVTRSLSVGTWGYWIVMEHVCVCVGGVCVCVCLGTLCSPSSLLQWYFPAKRFVCLFVWFFFHFIAGHDYNEGDDDKAFIIRCSAVSNPEALILNYSLYVFCSRLFWIGGLCVCVCVCVCVWITVSFFFLSSTGHLWSSYSIWATCPCGICTRS